MVTMSIEDVQTLFTRDKIELGDGKEELGPWCEVWKYEICFYWCHCNCYNLYPLFTSSHDRVLLSHNYSSLDSHLSQPCTFSHLLHHDSELSYLRNIYIDLGIHCKYPNLALLKYTWVPGQVPLGTFILISQYYWDISLSIVLRPHCL